MANEFEQINLRALVGLVIKSDYFNKPYVEVPLEDGTFDIVYLKIADTN